MNIVFSQRRLKSMFDAWVINSVALFTGPGKVKGRFFPLLADRRRPWISGITTDKLNSCSHVFRP